jgi:hypothetical protein
LITMDEMRSTWLGSISDDQYRVWVYYQRSRSQSIMRSGIDGWDKFITPDEDLPAAIERWIAMGLLIYDGRDYLPTAVWLSGNMYEKAKIVEQNKDRIIAKVGQEAYSQLAEITSAAIPKKLRLSDPDGERLFISPLDPICSELTVSGLTDGTAFDEGTTIVGGFYSFLPN